MKSIKKKLKLLDELEDYCIEALKDILQEPWRCEDDVFDREIQNYRHCKNKRIILHFDSYWAEWILKCPVHAQIDKLNKDKYVYGITSQDLFYIRVKYQL